MRIGGIVQIYCDNGHEKPERMEIREGREGLDNFYVCPKYKEESRLSGEQACMNNLSFRDYMEILEKVEKLLNDIALSGEDINLTNYRFSVGARGGFKTDCRIFYHAPDKIKIAIYNRKLNRR